VHTHILLDSAVLANILVFILFNKNTLPRSCHLTVMVVLVYCAAYTTFYILGLLCSMQVPFVGMQPIRTSEHMASAGIVSMIDCFQGINSFG